MGLSHVHTTIWQYLRPGIRAKLVNSKPNPDILQQRAAQPRTRFMCLSLEAKRPRICQQSTSAQGVRTATGKQVGAFLGESMSSTPGTASALAPIMFSFLSYNISIFILRLKFFKKGCILAVTRSQGQVLSLADTKRRMLTILRTIRTQK
jgi:hypothetical protein